MSQAIHHAHQRGFIHRDIKPSNILVTEQDGQAVPKVIDFGVARALSQSLTQETLLTQQGQLVGTPEYMSPERIDLADEGADTRSDVYSLGVLLYVLLAGVLPFESDALREGGLEHLRKVIREQDPKTPSTRLTGMGDKASEVALNRRTNVRALTHSLHKELEWIPLKAMRKERQYRYQSAAELAQDIDNYLSGAPLAGGPPSRFYRFKKFISRHRTSVAAVAVVGLTIIVGSLISLSMYVRAQIQAGQSRALSDLLTGTMLPALSPYRSQGGEVTVISALDTVAATIADQFEDAPVLEADVRHALATTYWGHTAYERATQHLRRALDLRRRELGDNHLKTISSTFRLGMALLYSRRFLEAEELLLEAVTRCKHELGDKHTQTLFVTTILAWNYIKMGENEEAIRLAEDVLTTVRSSTSEQGSTEVRAMYTIGLAQLHRGDFAEAQRWLAQAVQGAERVKAEDHSWLVNYPGWLGRACTAQGKYQEAERVLTRTLARARRVFGNNHFETLQVLSNLIRLYVAWNKPAEARRWRMELSAIASEDSSRGPSDIHYDVQTGTHTVRCAPSISMSLVDILDEFSFARKTLVGDGTITGRIDGFDQVARDSKAGVMIRDTMTPTSVHACVLVRPWGVIELVWRDAERGPTRKKVTCAKDFQLPHWVRLRRVGNTFIAEHSGNGEDWKAVGGQDPNQSGPIEIIMNETVHVGLVVTIRGDRMPSEGSDTTEVRFGNVAAAGVVTPVGPFTALEDISLLTALSQADRGRDRDK